MSDVTEMKVYDRYGEEVSLIYYGSTIEFSCDCTGACNRSSSPLTLMFNGQNETGVMKKTVGQLKFHLNVAVNNEFRIGSYACKQDIDYWQPIVVLYYLCE